VSPTGGVAKADASPVFTYALVNASAREQEMNGEFVVFKGSTARKEEPQGWMSYRRLRDQLVSEKKLVPSDNPELFVFAESVSFSSPTAGAVIVNAYNVSGRRGSWKVEGTNKTYHDWYEEKLAAVVANSVEIR